MTSAIRKLQDKEWLTEQYIDSARASSDIAREIGCNKSAVCRALKRHGIDARRRSSKWPMLNNDAWLYQKYIVEGCSTNDIAKIVGCTAGNVATHLEAKGIGVRSMAQAKYLADQQGKGSIVHQQARRKLLDREWIYNAYVNLGMTMDEIAESANCSRSKVARAMNHYDIQRRKPKSKYSKLNDKEWLVDAYVNQRLSTEAIAKLVGCDSGIVWGMLKQLGVQTRDWDEAQKLRADKNRMLGKRGYNWKGGRAVHGSGYIFIYRPDHPNAGPGGYVAEHRLVMSEKLGRPLEKNEVVHHIDGDKANNAPSNLAVMLRDKHKMTHKEEQRKMLVMQERILQLEAILREYENRYGPLEGK